MVGASIIIKFSELLVDRGIVTKDMWKPIDLNEILVVKSANFALAYSRLLLTSNSLSLGSSVDLAAHFGRRRCPSTWPLQPHYNLILANIDQIILLYEA